MPRGGDETRAGWLSPTGVSAIAAAATAVATGAAIVFGGGGGDGDSGQGRVVSSTVEQRSAEPTPARTSEPPPLIERSIEDIAQLTSLADEIAAGELPDGGPLGTFVRLGDDGGKVSAEVPAAWDDQEVTNWLHGPGKGEPVGWALLAVRDSISRYYKTTSTPGVFLGVADEVPGGGTAESFEKTQQGRLDANCIEAARGTVAGTSATGGYSVWTRCGDTGSMAVQYASTNKTGYTMLATFLLVSRQDVAAVDRLLRTLQVDPPVGVAGAKPSGNDEAPGDLLE